MSNETTRVTVATTVEIPIERAWALWTGPEHIIHWNSGSPDWHTPRATNDLRVGGIFTSRMEAKDGSMGFDFSGEYTDVKEHAFIAYKMEDGRQVEIHFEAKDGGTTITQIFDAENENPVEMQRAGWQHIMDNFRKYASSNS